MRKVSVFKSAEGRAEIRAYYQTVLAGLPLKQNIVDTPFGQTFVLEAGNAGHPPILLLHGSCSNSAAWLGDLFALCERFRVFAVDIPGEPGNSAEYRLDFQSDAHARWLCAVMDALALPRAAIAGNSMGGWIALQFATAYPALVSALALLAPSGIVPPKPAFLAQTATIASDPGAAKAANKAVTGSAALPKEVLAFMALVMENFIPFTGALPVLTDAQMRSLSMPVLLIAGMDDATMDAAQAAQRLQAIVPHAQVTLKTGAHVITAAATEILPFLEAAL